MRSRESLGFHRVVGYFGSSGLHIHIDATSTSPAPTRAKTIASATSTTITTDASTVPDHATLSPMNHKAKSQSPDPNNLNTCPAGPGTQRSIESRSQRRTCRRSLTGLLDTKGIADNCQH